MKIIERLLIILANGLWVIFSLKEYLLFKLASKYPLRFQEKYLKKIIKKNKNTEYGIKNKFNKIQTISDYQKYILITSYEDYKTYIQKIFNGEKNILTKDEVLLLEPTSGSSSPSKFIPYTKSLKQDFKNGINPWIVDLFIHNPKLLTGKAYWLITPAIIQNSQESKIKIGFEEDSEYLGFVKYFINYLNVIPKEIKYISDKKTFFYLTLLFLLKNKNISFISIWSPTFINLLFENLLDWIELLIKDLKDGKINDSFIIDSSLRTKLQNNLGKNPKRFEEIKLLLHEENIYEKLFPNLTIISCWTDSNSSSYVSQIKKYFPNIQIQSKGLIATECFISFPIYKLNKHVLSIRSHFFEFYDIIDNSIYLLNNLKIGRNYSVIITSSGGLYRYQIGDIIEVLDYYNNIPIIKFLGRKNSFSDLFGEKIHEEFIKNILELSFNNFNIKPDFYIVAPSRNIKNNKFRYVLYLENNYEINYASLAEFIEKKLEENFHYKYCIELGQLDRLSVFKISKNGLSDYTSKLNKSGLKLGNIKPKILHKELDWDNIFTGHV